MANDNFDSQFYLDLAAEAEVTALLWQLVTAAKMVKDDQPII